MVNTIKDNWWIKEDIAKGIRHSVYSGDLINKGLKCYKLRATNGSITKKDVLKIARIVIPEYLNEEQQDIALVEKI